ncbi:hypothetical protein SB847_20825, partial [Bacillus sp. SIMBA_026]
ARLGFANGAFEDSPDERAAVAAEFYPNASGQPAVESSDSGTQATLRDKLEHKAVLLGGKAA